MPVAAAELAKLFPLDALRPETREQLGLEASITEYRRNEAIFNAGDLVTWAADIKGNTAGGVGGGMFAEGVATMHGGVVTGNTAGDTGGGILTVNVLTLDNTRVFGNVPDDCAC